MTLPPATRQEKLPRQPTLASAVRPLPPWALELAPEPVGEASEHHRESLERLDKLMAESREATAELLRAEATDKKAAASAVASGKPVPTPKLEKAREVSDKAARAVEGAKELARDSQFAYVTALNDRRSELAATAAESLASVREDAKRAADELEQLLVRSRDLRTVERAIEHLSAPTERAQSFAVDERRAGRDPLVGATRSSLDQIRATLGLEHAEYERASWQ